MIPGPDIVIACPGCDTLARKASLTSGNTFGAVYWTDGKMDAPMLPKPPAIGKCPQCGLAYWLEDARCVGEITRFWRDENIPAEWEDALPPGVLDEGELLDAIDSGMGTTPERERYLRLLAWHAFNDQWRGKQDLIDEALPVSERQRRNMEWIEDALFDPEDFFYLLISAEAARQLGDFEKAGKILNHIDVEWIVRRREFLRELCAQGSRVVRLVPPDAIEPGEVIL